MLGFFSIPFHLQMKIGEKMHYFDHIQFEFSSNCGKAVAKATRHKIVYLINSLSLESTDIHFRAQSSAIANEFIWTRWSQMRELPVLPLFQISQIWVQSDDLLTTTFSKHLKNFLDFGEKAVVCGNKVEICFAYFSYEHSVPLNVFAKITEIFNITAFHADAFELEPDIFFLPSFQKIEDLTIRINVISENMTAQIKATRMFLDFENTNRGVAATTANIFLQQWFAKRRTIESLKFSKTFGLVVERMFAGLPFKLVRKYEEEQPKIELHIDDEQLRRICETADIFSIDRGDKCLLVFVGKWNVIGAMECNNVNDVIQF